MRKNLCRMLISILVIYLIFLLLNLNHNLELMKLQQRNNENKINHQSLEIKRLNDVVAYQYKQIQNVEPKQVIIEKKPKEVKESNPKMDESLSLWPITLVGISEILKSVINPMRNLSY